MKSDMRLIPRFNPDMLRLAREVRGLTLKDLAESSGIHANTLGRYEKAMKEMTPEDLDILSKALNFPIKFFDQRLPDTPSYRIECDRGWVIMDRTPDEPEQLTLDLF